MRIASFNILHGRSLGDGRVDRDRLTEACASLAADVLCLQEVDRGQARSGGTDQTEAVAEVMGVAESNWRFAPALVGEPGAEWRAATDDDEPGAPAYGIAMVSRLPVIAWHSVRLKAAPVKAPVVVPGGRGRFILLPDEPRVVLAAEIDTATGPMLVATTHLSFVPGWNLAQVRKACRALAGIAGDRPVILLGDMNFPGRLPAMASGWPRLGPPVRTYPAGRPRMQVDHALGHGLLPAVRSVTTVETALSDHLALLVDLDVDSAPGRDAAPARP